MDYEEEYWIDDYYEVEEEGPFRPSKKGIVARLLLLVLLLWLLVQMVLPRRGFNRIFDGPSHPPAEPIEPNYWL